MNTFKVNIKRNGEYVPLGATAVFPFSLGELLDERLDEAYITFYGSKVKAYRPTTEFKISVKDSYETTDYYFILAGDNSAEYPAGSGRYKHQCYLIERTKWLEGIVCSSLTFRNALGNNYLANSAPVSASIVKGTGYQDALPDGFEYIPQIKSPIAIGVPYAPPTPQHVYEAMKPHVLDGQARFITPRYLILRVNGTEIYNSEDNPSGTTIYTPQNEGENIEIEYWLGFDNSIYQKFYDIKFKLTTAQTRLPLRRLTITDVVNRCLELAVPLFKGQNPKYVFDGVTYVDGDIVPYSEESKYRPGSMADIFDKVYAPEFNLTQDTLREQLKVIGGYIHGEPWIDENNVVYYQIFSDNARSRLEGHPNIGTSASWHINEYNTELRSNAQNLVSSLGYAKGVITDPGATLHRTLRTDNLYIRIEDGNAFAETLYPIYEIIQVYCGIINQAWLGGDENYPFWLPPVDITPYIVEATQYGANLSSTSGGYPYSRSYAIYYTFGQKNLNGLFFKVEDAASGTVFSRAAITNILAQASGYDVSAVDSNVNAQPEHIVFSITYKPITSHYVSHGKPAYDPSVPSFARVYNQSENMVETQFFGEHVKGVAARLGNVELERTFLLNRMRDVPKTGQTLDGYVISAVSTEVMPRYIKSTVGLTRDFNRISQYVGVNSQKRMYEVSERQTSERSLLLKETLVIGALPENYSPIGKMFYSSMLSIKGTFIAGFSSEENKNDAISVAYMHGRKKGGTEDDLVTPNAVMLPVISRAIGNTMVFSFSLRDNYSAGTTAMYVNGGAITGRFQNDVRYTDYYGRIWWNQLILSPMYNDRNNAAEQSEVANFAFNTPKVTGEYFYNKMFADRRISIGADDTGAPLHRLRKDNAEVIQYNIELECKTTVDGLIIGSALASYCPLVDSSAATRANSPRLVLIASENSIGKFDKQYTPTDGDIVIAYSPLYDGTGIPRLNYTFVSADTNSFEIIPIDLSGNTDLRDRRFYGWAIITPEETTTEEVEDDDGNVTTMTYIDGNEILLASNKPFSGTDTILQGLNFYLA